MESGSRQTATSTIFPVARPRTRRDPRRNFVDAVRESKALAALGLSMRRSRSMPLPEIRCGRLIRWW